MTDQEFRPHVEAWLAAYQRELHLTKLITAGSARMAKLKMPKAVPTLDTLGDELAEVRRLEQGQSMLRQLQRDERQNMEREEAIIRQVLPQHVWYQVNGHGVRHYHGVQIQVRDWEAVQVEHSLAMGIGEQNRQESGRRRCPPSSLSAYFCGSVLAERRGHLHPADVIGSLVAGDGQALRQAGRHRRGASPPQSEPG